MIQHHKLHPDDLRRLEAFIDQRLDPIIKELKKMDELLKALALGDAQAKDRAAELAAANAKIKDLEAQLANPPLPAGAATAEQIAAATTAAQAIVTDTAPVPAA